MGFFANFQLNQVQNCCRQIKKMKARTFSFPLKKYTCQSLTDGARLKNVPPPLDLTRILKAYHKRNDRRKFPETQEWPIPCEVNCAACDWSKTVKHFSVNTHRKFLSWHEATRQPSNWISPQRYFSFFWLASYFNDVCCIFHLGKMFIKFLSIIFYIYCSLAPQLSCIMVDKTFRQPSFFHLLLAISFSKK